MYVTTAWKMNNTTVSTVVNTIQMVMQLMLKMLVDVCVKTAYHGTMLTAKIVVNTIAKIM